MTLVRIQQDGPESRRKGCTFGRWAQALAPAEKAALDGMLHDRRPNGAPLWSAREIADQINDDPDYSVVLSLQMVSRHRTGSCSCAH